jgi:hypothetical protein
VSPGTWTMTVRVLRAEDFGCESGIWRMTVRVLRAEDAGCESGYLKDDSQGAEGRGCKM